MPAPTALKQRLAALIDQAWDEWKASKSEINISERLDTDSRTWKLHMVHSPEQNSFLLRVVRK